MLKNSRTSVHRVQSTVPMNVFVKQVFPFSFSFTESANFFEVLSVTACYLLSIFHLFCFVSFCKTVVKVEIKVKTKVKFKFCKKKKQEQESGQERKVQAQA